MPIWIPLAIAATVQTAANIAGNVHARNVAKRNTDKTIATQKALADKAYQIEQQNIKAMNEYNSPKQQMQRFTEAGLNRNLIYQQGSPGNQTTFAKYQAPNVEYKYQPAFRGESIQPLTELPIKAQQIENLITQGRILKAEKLTKEALAKYADDLAKNKSRVTMFEADMKKFEAIFKSEEFQRFFYKTTDTEDGREIWRIRENADEAFTEWLANKWLKPNWDNEKTKAQTDLIKQQLELQSGVLPWLQPFIQFLKILVP